MKISHSSSDHNPQSAEGEKNNQEFFFYFVFVFAKLFESMED